MLVGTLPTVSNKADWIEAFELIDDETGDPVDISDATEIVVEVKDQGKGSASRLTASLSDGTISLIETGIFEWSFTASQMSGLCAGTYQVLCRITKDEQTAQLIIGNLPVVDG